MMQFKRFGRGGFGVWMLLSSLLLGAAALQAQEAAEAEEPEVGLQVGNQPPADGVVGTFPNGRGFHFRMEENRVFVFVLDEDGLIIAPDIHSMSLLLVGQMSPESIGNRQFMPLTRAGGRPAFTSARIITPPHIFTGTIYYFESDTPEATFNKSFRFNAVSNPETPGAGE